MRRWRARPRAAGKTAELPLRRQRPVIVHMESKDKTAVREVLWSLEFRNMAAGGKPMLWYKHKAR